MHMRQVDWKKRGAKQRKQTAKERCKNHTGYLCNSFDGISCFVDYSIMITDNGINTSGGAKRGRKKDNEQKPLIVKRQERRKFIEDLDILISSLKL